MKKALIRIGVGIVALAAIAGGGLYAVIKMNSPAAEERLAYNNDAIVANIDQQLAGIDLERVESKQELIEGKTALQLKESLIAGEFTHEELVAHYLLRIKNIDQSELGNNAISEINPRAMEQARAFDASSSGELYGLPVLLKENINTDDMPTSAGSYALKDFTPPNDAPFVTHLRNNGALILGKTNLSEMSHFMSAKNPSGYSAKKGQTHNPFRPLEISPLGSSTGSAVAMATGLAALSFGTETTGSIVAPASVNSIVGFKPSRNTIDGTGVIPISLTLDTVGPITTTVADAALAYDAAADTPLNPEFSADNVRGKRIGVVKSDDGFNSQLTTELEKMGAEVVEVSLDTGNVDNLFILNNDFEKDLNAYLTDNNAPIGSLAELVEYNKQDKDTRARYGQNLLEGALDFKDHDDAKVAAMVNEATTILDTALAEHKLDAIVFKDNEGAVIPAVAGAPEISVPFGMYNNQPAGATFTSRPGTDKTLMELAYSFEQNTKMRVVP